MSNGFIFLHRDITEWDWWDDHNTTRLFIYLIMKANHKPKTWRGVTIERGSLATGRGSLSEKTGLTEQQTRTSLIKLKSTNDITIKTTNKYSMISITNYDEYQTINHQNNQQITSNQPATQPTNNHKQESKNKKTNNIIIQPDDVEKSVWGDFVKLRKRKKSDITETAIKVIRKQATLAGWSMNDAIAECVMRGWIGFKAEWVNKEGNQNERPNGKTKSQRADDAMQEVLAEYEFEEHESG